MQMSDKVTFEAVMTEVKKLGETVSKQAATLENLSKPATPSSLAALFNGGVAPGAIIGESPNSSRGYSFLKAIGYAAGILSKEQAKVEFEVHEQLHKSFVQGAGYVKGAANSFLTPFCSSHLTDIDQSLGANLRKMLRAGTEGQFDPEEMMWLRKRYKALSWIDETTGGALVAPPMQGELIELLRNNEALMQAGARDIGMPPNGRITYPRQTGGATAYWVGQSQPITDSSQATGDVILTAKKLACLVKIPNELFRFSSISVEQFVREDIARVMALKLDKSLLEAVGSNVEPKGLINYANINNHTAATTGATGDTFQPEDVGDMISEVEEVDATFMAWIMRPKMYNKIVHRRADAVTAGDGKGQFMFSTWRQVGDNMNLQRGKTGAMEGYPVIKSTNVSKTRTKGGASTLSYILGGDFTDYIMALGGVVEFVLSTQGDTPFTQDQTWIRGIMSADGAPRHEASFILCDTLVLA